MKKYIASAIILVSVFFIWIIIINKQNKKEMRYEYLVKAIEENLEVKTYKNTLKLYEEIISLDSNNVDWYIQYAEAYRNLGQYGNYEIVCRDIIKNFPNEPIGYKMLLLYYYEDQDHEEVISTFFSIPASLKNDEDIYSIYQLSEWEYTNSSNSYIMIDNFIGNYSVVQSKDLQGYTNSLGQLQIDCKFEKARPFIESYAAVFNNEEWYFIDLEGDRVIATTEKIEDLHSFSEGYAVAKMDGKYGYIDKEINKYEFKYDNATNFYNGVAAVLENNKWALINLNFEFITDFIYDDVLVDSANICSRKMRIFTVVDNKIYMIDTNGNRITENDYEDVKFFYDTLAAVKKNNKWGFINFDGELVIDYQYDDANSFNLGIAPVKIDEYWGFIDEHNKLIVDTTFEEAYTVLKPGTVIVKSGGYRFIHFIKYK